MKAETITSVHISNYFTNKAIEEWKSPLTIMQALKLTYIAQGFHLVLEGSPFFEEDVYAWEYGPVIKELYPYLKNKSDENFIICTKLELNNQIFSRKQKEILDVVFYKYMNLSGWALSKLTHQQGTPWQQHYKKGEKDVLIPKNTIKKHFKKVIAPQTFVILLSEMYVHYEQNETKN